MLSAYNSYSPTQNNEQAINLYFVDDFGDGKGVATLPPSRASLVGEFFEENGIAIENQFALTSTVPHEFGHFFGLFHTWETHIGFERPAGHPAGPNGLTAGDLMSDTQAEPDPTGGGKPNWKPPDCSFDGKKFFEGIPYLPGVQLNSDNYMTSGGGGDGTGSCRMKYTTQQKNHMRDQFDPGGSFNDRNDLKGHIWIQVRNEINNSDAGGTYIVSSQNHNSDDFFLYPGQAVDITTGQERLQTDHKHHDWNDVDQEYKLTLDNFTCNSGTPPQFADFEEIKTATIKNYLISANGSDDGQIKFHDPWFLESDGSQPDSLIEFPSPYQPTGARNETSGGVFLNQSFTGNNPHYSVRADDHPINGINYFLDHWSGSNVTFQNPDSKTTAVVFTSANATVTANMKGHLVSAGSNALIGNNQRKIVYDDNGNYHLVYEENGEIYYTASDDNGATWANEVRISDGSGDNKYPSIDLHSVNSIPIVVWQRDNGFTGDIFMRRKFNGSWETTQLVTQFFASPGFTATPVINGYATSYYFIIWHDYDENNLRICSYNSGNGSFGIETTIPGTNSNSLYPSLAADRFAKLHLAWAESGKIYYTKINHSNGGNYTFSPSKEEVSQLSGYSNHVSPSISVDYDIHPQVMWQAYSGPALESQIIVHRWRSTGAGGKAWGPFSSFIGNENYVKPSIMS